MFQIVNITMAGPGRQQQPVNIFFAVRGSGGYLLGSEVTNLLLRLTMVEFSYYMGFPVLEIAERESFCGSYSFTHSPIDLQRHFHICLECTIWQ